jgi:hypothetical protein
VAIFVAHELFAKPTLSHEELCREWQARVPGVGEAYQLNVEQLLQGVAIRNNNDEWQYLPADKLAKSPVSRLAQLFAAREKWIRRDLEPYLKSLTPVVDEILIKHTHTVSEQVDGETMTMYVTK